MTEVCPFDVPKPAVSVAIRAGQLARKLLDPLWEYQLQDVPPVPEKVLNQGLNSLQVAKYETDAAAALHIAAFALRIREPENDQRLREGSKVTRFVPRFMLGGDQGIFDRAITKYSVVLGTLAVEHHNDPIFENIRRYWQDAAESHASLAEESASLWISETRGRLTFIEVAQDMSHAYHRLNMESRDETKADVLRNSMRTVRYHSAMPLLKLRALDRVSSVLEDPKSLYEAGEIDDKPALLINRDEVNQRLKIAEELPPNEAMNRLAGRTYNACSALPPIPGYTTTGAIELLLDQMVTIFEDARVLRS